MNYLKPEDAPDAFETLRAGGLSKDDAIVVLSLLANECAPQGILLRAMMKTFPDLAKRLAAHSNR